METSSERDLHIKPTQITISNLTESSSSAKLTPSQKRCLRRKKKKLEKQGNIADNSLTDCALLPAESCQETPTYVCVEPIHGKPDTNLSLSVEKATQSVPKLSRSKRSRLKKRKRKEEERNALKDTGGDIQITDAKLAERTSIEDTSAINERTNCSPSLPNTVLVQQQETNAKHCTDLSLYLEKDTQSDLNLTRRKIRKLTSRKKKKEERNALEDTGYNIHMTDAKVAGKCDDGNCVSEVRDLKLTSTEDKSAITERRNYSPSHPNNVFVQQRKTDAEADTILSETQNPNAEKRKRKRDKRRKISDSSENSLVAIKGNGVMQTSLNHSNGESFGNNEGNSCSGIVGVELTSEKENTDIPVAGNANDITGRKRNRNKKSLDNSGDSLKAVTDNHMIQTLPKHSDGKHAGKDEMNSVPEVLGIELTAAKEISVITAKIGPSALVNPGSVKHQVADSEIDYVLTGSQAVETTKKKQKRPRLSKWEREKSAKVSEGTMEALKEERMSNGQVSENIPTKKGSDCETANKESEMRMEVQKIEQAVSGISSVKDVSILHKDEEKVATQERKVLIERRLPRMDEEEVTEMEEVISSSSRFAITDESVAPQVACEERNVLLERHLARGACCGHSKRKLLVLDLNGILADVVQGHPSGYYPDAKLSGKSVFKRPFVRDFLRFCFERFDVGIWSSRLKHNVKHMIEILMRDLQNHVLFRWSRDQCTKTKFKTLENNNKPLVMKEVRKLWNQIGQCGSCGKQKYDESNTLLVDDSPYKALLNPPYTGVFPYPYQYTDAADSALGRMGDLRLYLERLAEAENVQKFVEENPFGQPAISESHHSWAFYSMVKQGTQG